MGKKSKRKGGGKIGKAARRERLQERREQQLEDVDERKLSVEERPFFVGDRVWFRVDSTWGDGSNPYNYRGIVKAVQEASLDIVPIQSKLDGVNLSIRVTAEEVFPDFCDMTLRFDVGDEVLCFAEIWVPETVSYHWPIGEVNIHGKPTPRGPADSVPHYKCGELAAPEDDDYCIMKRPPSFRIAVGETVVFDPMKAVFQCPVPNRSRLNRSWLEGTVKSVGVTGMANYGAYRCVFNVNGKQHSCYIVKDDVEHVVRSDVDPRTRLFDAIEQDCSREHLMYLTTAFKIDVTTFRDLVVSKACEHASYHALSWLQHNCNTDVLKIKDDSGNNILHKIAASSQATRFIEEAGKVSFMEPVPDWKLDLAGIHAQLTNSVNDNGETWLQVLVRHGNIKALDAAMSPRRGLAWELAYGFYYDEGNLSSLEDSITNSGSVIMQCIFASFASFRALHQQYHAVLFCSRKSQDELLKNDSMTVFEGRDALHHAKLLARFFLDWHGYRGKLGGNPFTQLVVEGFFDLFQLMYRANKSLLLNATYRVYSNEDRKEYVQPELLSATEDSCYDFLEVDIYMACIIGTGGLDQSILGDNFERWYYLKCLHDYAVFPSSCYPNKCGTWLSQMKVKKSQTSKKQKYWENKIRLLEDDENVEERLKILEFLLQREPNADLNVLEAIRHRQCAVMRFMVDKGLVQLEADASTNKHCKKYAPKLQFLESGQIPFSMTMKCFLCFAAVEYDDLQSLQWLCESSGVPTETINGMNLLHFSAFMGRVEMICWLHEQPSWQTLAMEVCYREPFQNSFAVHVAAIQGHIFAVELMVAFKVPEADKKGKVPEHYAKKSQHEFVREWAAKREKPSALQRNIKKLLHLINAPNTTTARLKKFIIASKCLDVETWDECEYSSFDAQGPSGSFGDIVGQCCSKYPDQDFVFWLCLRLYFWDVQYGYGRFWKTHRVNEIGLNLEELNEFAHTQGYQDLVEYLPKRWFNKISVADPTTRNMLLKTILGADKLLHEVRSKILRISVLEKIANTSAFEIRRLFRRGGRPDELDELLCINSEVRKALKNEGHEDSYYGFERNILSGETDLDPPHMLDTIIYAVDYGGDHPLAKQMPFRGRNDLCQIHVVLATVGDTDLLEYCLNNFRGWSVAVELDVIWIASFFGHSNMLDLFLGPDDGTLLSDFDDRFQEAILGTGASCRCRDLVRLVKMYDAPYDPVKEGLSPENIDEGNEQSDETRETIMEQSLICNVLNGYATESFDYDIDNKKEFKTLRFLVDKLSYKHGAILDAMWLLSKDNWDLEWMDRIVGLLQNVMDVFHLQPIMHHEQMRIICKEIVEGCEKRFGWKDPDGEKKAEKRILAWLEQMADLGIDIQNLVSRSLLSRFSANKDFMDDYHSLERKQLHNWSRYDIIKTGASLEEIKRAINEGSITIYGRDRGGLMLTHLSSAYNRTDLLEWLVLTRGMDINACDGQGRNTLDVAKAANAKTTTKWIMKWHAKRRIAAFVKRNYHRLLSLRKRQRQIAASTTIQKHYRGQLIRKIYSRALLHRLEESQQFSAVWGQLVRSVSDFTQISSSWSSLRERVLDIKRAEFTYDDNYFNDTDEHLCKALEGALQLHDGEEMVVESNNEAVPIPEENSMNISEGGKDSKTSWLTFQMTSHVVKFLRQGDPKYKSFFVRRMQQLADGERSRILQKRLKGSQTTIYESYLEQKSGFRILWTEEGKNIIVWFVAKHKEVSRLMKLIDDSKSRSARQQLPEALVSELQTNMLLPQTVSQKEVLLDVFGNVPIKLYDVSFHTIDEITLKDWIPKLHLTDEERDVVESEGTILVLGRSGTGKTVCICNRMEYDRQKFGQDQTFSQLFVARSKRLCSYVSEAVGKCSQNSFRTFEDLLYDVEATLPLQEEGCKSFLPSQRIDFHRFKQEFYGNRSPQEKKVGILIIWTVIRTFIKGSIEAFQSPGGFLHKDDFVAVEKLGKNRCRVPVERREFIYDEFLRYEKYKTESGQWDDCDRIRYLLSRLNKSKKIESPAFDQVRKSRIYVDEIQDYTQIECLVFFYLAGPGGLFLAGDPAQSVVEGTEFRFDEIRSVGYFVANSERRDLIPQKPKTVNINFRSHAGILNVASAFLDFLFKYFPGSAKQLKKDCGLFQGSRPGVLHKVKVKQLKALLSDKLKGTVVLCHDDSTHHWRRALGDYKLVYDIREAKGLEFKSVIILNFFQELPSSLQKPWRNLFLNREGLDFETKHPLVGMQLKLLYTGITRCIERLFFVETAPSIAGDTIVRWLTTSSVKKAEPTAARQGYYNYVGALATRNNVEDIEAMAMTSDEFLSEGFNNAELAESAKLEDLEQIQNSLDRAIWCFDQAGEAELAAKARTHRLSIQFRRELVSIDGGNDLALVEIKGARMMESLAKEGLLFEVLNVFYSISPFIPTYTKEELERRFISKMYLTAK